VCELLSCKDRKPLSNKLRSCVVENEDDDDVCFKYNEECFSECPQNTQIEWENYSYEYYIEFFLFFFHLFFSLSCVKTPEKKQKSSIKSLWFIWLIIAVVVLLIIIILIIFLLLKKKKKKPNTKALADQQDVCLFIYFIYFVYFYDRILKIDQNQV
jgi:cytochrome bd-type quinol oxidase subunit 2